MSKAVKASNKKQNQTENMVPSINWREKGNAFTICNDKIAIVRNSGQQIDNTTFY